jgi:tRNA 2-selenouridine synthase
VSGVATQIDFENSLGIDLLRKMRTVVDRPLVVEDESRRIGACAIPQELYEKMHAAPMAVVEMPVEFRVQRILQEYVIDMTAEFSETHPEDGWPRFVDYLTQSLARVKKRLGPENYQRINGLMETALARQLESGDIAMHEAWITALLADYYDPMCDYQLDKQPEKIVFRGSYDEVLAWARQ